MGWMHDTLEYFKKEPIYRKHHQDDLTFSMTYAFTENFMLPLSHDEVVYGKHSILGRMPGDEWQKFGNLRLLYSFMFTHPGAKLLFMGGEFGQSSEWNFEQSLDWHMLEYDYHKGIKSLISDLNKLYKKQSALFEKQFSADGFEWINYSDSENSVISYIRKGNNPDENVIIVCNLTPVIRENYRIGIPTQGKLKEIFNSDKTEYGGSGVTNKKLKIDEIPWNGKGFSSEMILPPLGVMVFRVS
jgi:1,4-alpha-glucan branching enzyme